MGGDRKTVERTEEERQQRKTLEDQTRTHTHIHTHTHARHPLHSDTLIDINTYMDSGASSKVNTSARAPDCFIMTWRPCKR